MYVITSTPIVIVTVSLARSFLFQWRHLSVTAVLQSCCVLPLCRPFSDHHCQHWLVPPTQLPTKANIYIQSCPNDAATCEVPGRRTCSPDLCQIPSSGYVGAIRLVTRLMKRACNDDTFHLQRRFESSWDTLFYLLRGPGIPDVLKRCIRSAFGIVRF